MNPSKPRSRVRADWRYRAIASKPPTADAVDVATGAKTRAKTGTTKTSGARTSGPLGVPSSVAELDVWMQAQLQEYLREHNDEKFLRALRHEAQLRRAGGEAVFREYGGSSARGETMVIAFGGLQQHIGGGKGGGMPPHEFVKSCRRAGARHALFVRDATRSWYCRGLGSGAFGDGRRCESFDELVESLRSEVARLKPRRVITIGSSMGGYAAVRAGIALNASRAIGFSPQVGAGTCMRVGTGTGTGTRVGTRADHPCSR